MSFYRSTLVALSLFFVAIWAIAGCGSSAEPVTLDLCADVECVDGLFCDGDTGHCVCDETSCGEGALCEEGDRCVDAPHTLCEWGTTYVEGQGCQCDPDVCDGDGWSCADEERCLFEEVAGSCIDGTGWSGDEPIFADVSDQAGLAELDVRGIRLATADLTGNGYPDLLVRHGLAGADDFGEDGARQSWFLANQGDGTFEDITQQSGLLQRRHDVDPDRGRPAEVFAIADVDNSGALDVVTLFTNQNAASPEGAEIMLNDGSGQFTLGPVSEPLHSAGMMVARSGAAFVDVDRNGFVDLWIGQGGQDLLLLGDGTGSFEDGTDDRGLSTPSTGSTEARNQALAPGNTWSVAACDLDGDGRQELLSAAYGRAPNHLWNAWLDEGITRFDNHSVDSGYAYDHRMDWTDNESARCYCMHNRDADDCADVPEPQYIVCNSAADAIRWTHGSDRHPYRLGGNSGTTVCADLNNNGRLDLLTTEIVHWDVGSSSDPSEILYNTGESPPRFERPGNEATGLTRQRPGVVWDDGDITAAAFDFDNDGRLDILIASTDYPGTRAHLYHQQEDGTFELVPIELGIDHTSAHGLAVADFNGNGLLDVAIGHSRARCSSGDHCLDEPHVRLFENQLDGVNNWIQLDLEGGQGTNRAAIGARIDVVTDELHRVAQVDGGHGHYGIQHDLVQHFGLGDACHAKVVITWPDADNTREVYRLPAGHRYEIVQGQRPVVRDLQ